MRALSVVMMCFFGCCKDVPVKDWRPVVEVWNNYSYSCDAADNGGSQTTSREFNSKFCRANRGALIGIGGKL